MGDLKIAGLADDRIPSVGAFALVRRVSVQAEMGAAAVVSSAWRPLIRLTALRNRSDFESSAQAVPNHLHLVVAVFVCALNGLVVPVGPVDVRFKDGHAEWVRSVLNNMRPVPAVQIRYVNAVLQGVGPVELASAANGVQLD